MKNFFTKLINLTKNQEIQICLISLLIAIVTYIVYDNVIRPDLDYSWEYAMNYFFINHLEHGKDIIWPYGPLGFLLFSTPLWTYKYVAIFYFVFNFFFCYFSTRLFYEAKKGFQYIVPCALVIIYLFATIGNMVHKLTIFPLLTLLIYVITRKKRWFYMTSIFSAIMLMLKTGIGAISAVSLFVFVIYELFTPLLELNKNNKKEIFSKEKDIFILAIKGCALYFITLILIWLIFYQNIQGLFNYIYWQINLSFGYAQTLTYILQEPYKMMLVVILCFTIIPFCIKDKDTKYFHIIALFTVLLFMKYSMVRHGNYIFPFLVVMLFFYFVYIKKITKEFFIYTITLLVLMVPFTTFNETKSFIKGICKTLYSPPGATNIIYELWNPAQSMDDATMLSGFVLHGSLLNKEARAYLNNYSVDIYPFENTFAYTNNLNWTPRFLFHGYMTYTPELDKKNVEFLSSKKAPKYILWHKVLYDFDKDFAKRGVLSFDRKYVFNDDPQTMQAFLNYYGTPINFNNVFILKRLDKKIDYKKEYSKEFFIKYNEWIDVEQKPNTIQLISLKFKRTLNGKLMNLISRDVFAYIDYEFFDGTMTRYKLTSIDNLIEGAWVNPHIWEISDRFVSRKVKRIRITIDNPETLENNITAKWIYIGLTKDMWLQPDFSMDNILNDSLHQKKILEGIVGINIKDNKSETKNLEKNITLKKNKNYIIELNGKADSKHILFPKIYAATIQTNCQDYYNRGDFMLIFDGKTHTYKTLLTTKNDCKLDSINMYFEDKDVDTNEFKFKIFEADN